MAKEQTDRTTWDLFADEPRPGRPKTNPLSRHEQLKINKRNQLTRYKSKGLRRVEQKINEHAVAALNILGCDHELKRSIVCCFFKQKQQRKGRFTSSV